MNNQTHVPFARPLVDRLIGYMDQAPTGAMTFKEVLVLRRDLEQSIVASNEIAQAAEKTTQAKVAKVKAKANGAAKPAKVGAK